MVSTILCGGEITLDYTDVYHITVPGYICSPENCIPAFNWSVKGPVSGNGIGSPFSFYFPEPGVYSVTIIPICGQTSCSPCGFTITINSDCRCGIWPQKPVVFRIAAGADAGFVYCDSTITLPVPGNYEMTAPGFLCSPETCMPFFKWQVNGPVSGMGSGNPFAFNFALPGSYTVVITPYCGIQECSPCKFILNIGSVKTQVLDFRKGWNIFSFNTLPDNPDMKAIFMPLIDGGYLVKIQDENGNALEDLGIFGGWVNSIGDLSLTEGYKIKVTGDCLLTVQGSGITLPFEIPFRSGWNIIGYPRETEADGMVVVQQLIDRTNLIKVQDENGNAIEDLGIFGGWKNYLGNFIPGDGYKLKAIVPDSLTIEETYPKTGLIVRQKAATTHFRSVAEGKGVDHMNINLTGLVPGIWQTGDEIGVFDGNLCVGAIAILPYHLENQVVPLIASADDDMDGAGFTEGRPFILRLWKRETGKEYLLRPEILSGTSTFVKHESALLSLENMSLTGFEDLKIPERRLVTCYPNPTNGKIHVRIDNFPPDGVQAEIINALGQKVLTRVIGAEPFTIDLSGNVSGIYYLKVTANIWYEVEKIILK